MKSKKKTIVPKKTLKVKVDFENNSLVDIHIHDDQHTDYTWNDEDYDDEDEEWYLHILESNTSHNISGFSTGCEACDSDLEVPFMPEYNKDYFLLYVLYSDSRDEWMEYGLISYIGLFENEDIAKKNKKIIEKHYDKNKNYDLDNPFIQQLFLLSDSGNKYNMECDPWFNDYIVSTSEINVGIEKVQRIKVLQKKKSITKKIVPKKRLLRKRQPLQNG